MLCCLISHFCQSQYYYYTDKYYDHALTFELGSGLGAMNSLTDLGGNRGNGKPFIKDLNIKNTHFSYGFYAAATYKYAIALRIEAAFGKVSGYDSIMKSKRHTAPGRYERNLSFESRIADFQLALEIHPLFFKLYEENKSPYLSPYLIAGIGLFHFNPMTEINGIKYYLQPLRTEGQGFEEYKNRKPYKLTQVNFPIGIGLRYEASPLVNIRFEIVHRILQTDYLDDVSTNYINPDLFNNYLLPAHAALAQQLYARRQEIIIDKPVKIGEQRGNPKKNDAYFTMQLKMGVNIGRLKR